MRCAICSLVLVIAAAGCNGPFKENLPPAERLMHPGPGVDGPGPGVMMYQPAVPTPPQTSQVAFVGPEGMVVNWDVGMPGAFDSEPLVCPGRYNFPEGAIYRLKLTNIPGRPGVELYPTIEVAPVLPRTTAFLAHNSIPVQFTEEDFGQVLSGNFVTKVIYLPDAEYQELALAGVETLVSTRLEPGMDPIVEADRRGAILAIIRLGNKDLEMPGSMPNEGSVMQTAYGQAMPGGPCPTGPATMGPFVAGVTAPQYGMPMSGTPIGLPGPPHVPFGVPAGLQKHVMRNFTPVHLPNPTSKVSIAVRQKPGMSYPKPANHVFINEKTHGNLGIFSQPCDQRVETISADPCVVPCPTPAY